MKKIYMFIVLWGLSTQLFAQTPTEYFYGNQQVVYENPYGWGYIAGTNEYLDKGKYQRFDFYDQGSLTAATLFFGVMKIVGEPDSIWIVVRDVTEAGAPGDVLTKFSTTTNLFDTLGIGTTVFFPNAIQINGGFLPDKKFIGFEWIETTDDTFCVFADSNGFGDLENRAWEQFSDGTLQEFNNPSDFSWHLDADLWIKALLDFPQDVEQGLNNLIQPYNLSQNYPNPFNPTTTIHFVIPNEVRNLKDTRSTEYYSVLQNVTLKVYDVLGREVATLVNEQKPAGNYEVKFDASQLSSGIYFYRLEAGSFAQTRKMILMK